MDFHGFYLAPVKIQANGTGALHGAHVGRYDPMTT